ncbi:hypothetical protein Syn7502_02822 [Synechococcus sp. PCC 7502]|uniref:hypothetical protein n=1 Tax=Synechococcus sp. PCC 7502 TaxID=1173263 RepID=UPI00029FE55A|nr:hypothetical protein [Synechococcus sp. PCC 7502]AFY74759.1 hypothetical protein Syn7502_02822 [Synechococcus sp. PCC 7502]
MLLAEKKSDCIEMLDQLDYQQLTQKQLDGIKSRAIELWGDNWLAELARGYERVTGAKQRSKFTQLQRYFKGDSVPNLDSMNAMLIALDCKFKMECFTVKTLDL